MAATDVSDIIPDEPDDGGGEPLVSLFHRIGRVLPEGQVLTKIPPSMSAREAMALMEEKRFSQLPVMEGNDLIGIFSYRSFARRAARFTLEDARRHDSAIADFPVEECLEQFESRRVSDELVKIIGDLDKDNGVLISTNTPLPGIITPVDLLRYLYNLSLPFILLTEIEQVIRALIRYSVDDEQLIQCARRSLAERLGGEANVPQDLAAMTFGQYRAIIVDAANWPLFELAFGRKKTITDGKLQEINSLRNVVFHFKRVVTEEDTSTLLSHRDWLLGKAKQADQRRRGNQTGENNG